MLTRVTNENSFAYFSLIMGLLNFACAEAVIKFSSKTYHAYEIFFFRSLFLLLFVIIVAAATKKLHHFKTSRLRMHFLRSFFSAGSFLFSIKSLAGLELYSFKALSFVSPVFIAALGVIVLKEHFDKKHLLAFVICLIGIAIAFTPGSEVFSAYGLYAISAAISTALAILTFKKMANTETTLAIILYYSIACILLSFFLIDFNKVRLDFDNLHLFAIMAFFHLIASFFYTYGLRIHNLTAISLVSYLALSISMSLGFALWREWPTFSIFVAGVLIIVSNAILQLKKDHLIALKRKIFAA